MPGDNDFATIRLVSGTFLIDQDIGHAGGGIKTIRLEGGTLALDNSAPRKILFSSGGTDPVGSGTSTNPGSNANAHGFFVAKGVLDLRATASKRLTISSGDDVNKWYIHHEWGDAVAGIKAFNPATIQISYADLSHIGLPHTVQSGKFGAIYCAGNGTAALVSVDHCRLRDYARFYFLGGTFNQGIAFESNTFLNGTEQYTIFMSGVTTVGTSIRDNVEQASAFRLSGGSFIYSSTQPENITVAGNAVLHNSVAGRQLIRTSGRTGRTNDFGVIEGNLVVGFPSTTVSNGAAAYIVLGSRKAILRNNIAIATRGGMMLGGFTGTTSSGSEITGNFQTQHAADTIAQGTSIVFSGQDVKVANNVGVLETHSGNFGFFALDYVSAAPHTGAAFDKNTVWVNGTRGTTIGILAGEGGNGPRNNSFGDIPVTGSGNAIRSNLISNASRCILDGNELNSYRVDDLGGGVLVGVHHNATHGCDKSYGRIVQGTSYGSGWRYGTVDHPSSLYGDMDGVDPQFVDTGRRTVAAYDAAMGGPGTDSNVFDKLARRSGWGGTYDARYDIETIRKWLMSGFLPQNPPLWTAAHDGGTVGAVDAAWLRRKAGVIGPTF